MGHIVAIIGSGVSGAEAAFRLCARNVKCVVFEQNLLPYGKLESGLPKWHINLRNLHESRIDAKMNHPNVCFVPGVRIGRDIGFRDLIGEWGFSAVLLATGAWKDRPLPVEGIDEYIGKGLYYQNPFVSWYNNAHDPGYSGETCDTPPGSVVIGGGLASLDVVKILMIESVRHALQMRGIHTDPVSMEFLGIPGVLNSHGLSFDTLGIEPCTLYYRRSAGDMPLSPDPSGKTPESMEKTRQVRLKILNNLQEKFPFKLVENSVPVDKLAEGNRLVGLIFRKTEIRQERVREIPGSEYAVKAPLVISAIGSIPEPIPGVPMNGLTFAIKNPSTGQLEGFEHVFALGNAVTGRGNIRDSQLHGRQVADYVHDRYLAWNEKDYRDILGQAETGAGIQLERIGDVLENTTEPSPDTVRKIRERAAIFQSKSGYNGNYGAWIERHKPLRIEEL